MELSELQAEMYRRIKAKLGKGTADYWMELEKEEIKVYELTSKPAELMALHVSRLQNKLAEMVVPNG